MQVDNRILVQGGNVNVPKLEERIDQLSDWSRTNRYYASCPAVRPQYHGLVYCSTCILLPRLHWLIGVEKSNK